MTNYLLGIATGVAITYAAMNLEKVKALIARVRGK